MVFVDESAESVAALDLVTGSGCRCRFGCKERESAVRTLAVVMRCVEAQHAFEVAAAEDQQPVETLGADGADEALGIGIRLRCADRRVDHLDRLAAEDLVERAR